MRLFVVIFACACLVFAAESTDSVPFWKEKKEVYKRITEDRAIIVSAKVDKIPNGEKLTVTTAGLISAPVDFSHKFVMNFDEYSTILPYIKKINYDRTTNNIFVHGGLLGYYVSMTIKLKPEKILNGYLTNWTVISGNFKGMTGYIREEAFDQKKTEISMNALYLGKSVDIPGVIMQFGLEVAGRKAASSMRSYIEEQWEKQSSKVP
jgi:hypothetical protein